jgi:type II secretory pathway pseudopilin PulG
MQRFAALTLSILMSAAALSCQSYSTGLQQSVARADETAATGALRTIALAQQTYAVSNSGNYGSFQQLAADGYLDSRFNSETVALKDYVLTMETGVGAAGPFFKCHAEPTNTGAQAGRHFYLDSTSQGLHVNATQAASASDPLAQP